MSAARTPSSRTGFSGRPWRPVRGPGVRRLNHVPLFFAFGLAAILAAIVYTTSAPGRAEPQGGEKGRRSRRRQCATAQRSDGGFNRRRQEPEPEPQLAAPPLPPPPRQSRPIPPGRCIASAWPAPAAPRQAALAAVPPRRTCHLRPKPAGLRRAAEARAPRRLLRAKPPGAAGRLQ